MGAGMCLHGAVALTQSNLQALFQSPQFSDLLLNAGQLVFKQFLNVRARGNILAAQNEQFTDLVQRETQLLGFANEPESLKFLRAEQAKATLSPGSTLQQSRSFVKSDRVDAEPGRSCRTAYLCCSSHDLICTHA